MSFCEFYEGDEFSYLPGNGGRLYASNSSRSSNVRILCSGSYIRLSFLLIFLQFLGANNG